MTTELTHNAYGRDPVTGYLDQGSLCDFVEDLQGDEDRQKTNTGPQLMLRMQMAYVDPDRYEPREILQNNAGARISRRRRVTGTTVTLYDARESDMDEEAGRWATVCEQHGNSVNHPTRSIAESHLSHPDEWCPDCQEERDSKEGP